MNDNFKKLYQFILIYTSIIICLLAMDFDMHSISHHIRAITLNDIAVHQDSIKDMLRIDFQTKPPAINVGKTFIIIASLTNNSPSVITFTIKCNSLSQLTLYDNSQVKQLQSGIVKSGPIRFISLNPGQNQLITDPCPTKFEAISEGNIKGTANLTLYDESGVFPKYSFQNQEFQFTILS
jgi:hypothetical protein